MKHRYKYTLASKNTSHTYRFGAYDLKHVCEIIENLRNSKRLSHFASATLYDSNGDVVPLFEQTFENYMDTKNYRPVRRQKRKVSK